MKLKGLNNEAWVTCATTDQEATNCIVLAKSLNRVLSTRDIVVFVSNKVSQNLRNFLHAEFDWVLLMPEDNRMENIQPHVFGKLSSLTLKSYEKCCFVSPNMMFLKNADQIFENFADVDFACPEKDASLPIFIFKPSIESYNVLMDALIRPENGNGDRYLQNWFKNQHANRNLSMEHLYIGPEFHRIIFLNKGVSDNPAPVSNTPVIVRFMDGPDDVSNTQDQAKDLGLVDYHAIKIWKELYQEFMNDQAAISKDTAEMLIPINNAEPMRDPIAVVGMSCRYPGGANSLEEFWQLLLSGEDGTGNPPPFRWLREQCSRNRPDCRTTNAGFLQVPVDEFDAKFFGISPKEVHFLDPQHRLLHELVWEGLEDAAVDPMTLRGTNTGVFMGSWTNNYKDILAHAGETEFYRTYMGNSIGAAAARISFLLGLTGPSVATESGCSSAMVAVHLACRSLLLGETNMALACGVNLLLHPFDQDEMPMVISPEGHCKTFDAKADGFARAEGCGVLVLKRLSDAVKDKDNIWALIKGSGVSQEGMSRSMGTPTVHSESLAMEHALKDARVNPKDISYIEAHGSGTVVGDPMEIAAIAKAYGSVEREEPLIIASVKTNIGHTESCSGITGIMKTVLAMHHEMIPAHRNFDTLNPNINLESIPAIIPLQHREWRKCGNEKRRIAGVSSFGITGTDAHVIIEESPLVTCTEVVSALKRPKHLLTISAKTEEALDILLDRYKENIKNNQSELADICYTANTGRASFPFRAVVIGEGKDDVVNKINQGSIMKQEVTEDSGKICFLFTGQGSQYPGMAKTLYETSPVFQMHFDYCEGLMEEMYGISIRKVIWDQEPNETDVSRTIYSQTSIFCVEYALLKLWESWGVKPDYALGHSLGEFAAAVCAGILEPQDAIKLVAERSRLIDNLPEGKMLVIWAAKSTVDKHMKLFAGGNNEKILDYAAINTDQQTVVAGDSETILDFGEYLSNLNVKSVLLQSSQAFHSKHMDPMLDEYRRIAETITYKESINCAFISGMRGSLLKRESSEKGVNAEYWVQHTRHLVDFVNASKTATELGCQIFIEVGPQPVLSALIMMNSEGLPNITCLPSIKKTETEWDTLLETLGKLYLKGVSINWNGFDDLYPRKKTRLPHYPFIGKKFWPDVRAITENSIHPLLGSPIPNACSTKIFQNGLNLRCLEYVKDHVIGKTAVFPGAAYLEMSLAAGLATMECSSDTMARPSRPMKLENLSISAPLALEESKTCQVQTIVDFNTMEANSNSNDWNDLTIKICQLLDSKWLTHATASFTPLPSAEEIKNVEFDKANFLKMKEQPSDDIMIAQTYEKLASVGLKFGPTFQSLEKVWRDDCRGMLAKVKIPPMGIENGESRQYIIHPAVLDAMMQTIRIYKLSEKIKKLCVPIKISKFLWLANQQGEELYIYTRNIQEGLPNQAVLVDEVGTVIAEMSGVVLIDTTLKAVESLLEQQTSAMPDLWEETWREEIGPIQNRKPSGHNLDEIYTLEFRDRFEKDHAILEEQEFFFKTLEDYIALWMLNGLYDCGWHPQIHVSFTSEEIVKELKIVEAHTKFINYFMEVFEMNGFLKKTGVFWKIIAIPPSKNEIKTQLSQTVFTDDLIKNFDPLRLIQKLGHNLARLLQGHQSALAILFPEDIKNNPSAAKFYVDYDNAFRVGEFHDIVKMSLTFLREQMKAEGDKACLRIIEIGGGTGNFTRVLLQIFEEMKVEYEYTFTDISSAFFPSAEKRFEKYLHNMKFKKLNIEEDPMAQGFCPDYYDYVVASDVIHATRDICESLKNCRKLLRNGGELDIIEQIQKNRIVTFIFGLLEGFWRFDDFRTDHCIIDCNAWEHSLQKSGFENTFIFRSCNERHALITSWASKDESDIDLNGLETGLHLIDAPTWLLFAPDNSKLSKYLHKQLYLADRRVVVVQPSARSGFEKVSINRFFVSPDTKSDFENLMESLKSGKSPVEGVIYLWALDGTRTKQEELLQPYFYIAQTLLSLKQKLTPRLYVVTRGVAPVGDADLSNFQTSTLWGFTKSLINENIDMKCRSIGVAHDDANLSEREMKEVCHEIWLDDKESQVVYANGFRHVARLQPLKVMTSDLPLPLGTNRFQLILPDTKSFADLSFGPMEPVSLAPEEIEIQVYASALNFRDVFSVLKPIKYFDDMNAVGFDFSGIVKKVGPQVTKWKVGDYVFGLNMKGNALPSHVQLHEKDVWKVPDRMTLCEAATLPAVVITSYSCVIDVAKITKEDTVLIHAASGGVGLSAIEIVRSIGATIFATAGSKRKQNYLRSLGIKHIFNSRTTDFGDQILEVTYGRGVDVVLNSLTSEGFKEASLKACAKGARFVEMSKLSVWEPEEVQKLRPDVEYTRVDLAVVTQTQDERRRLMKKLEDLASENIVNPVPYVRFDAVNIREALQYLQKAKHIGKVVCVMPQLRMDDGVYKPFTPMFSDRSTYLITGGLGAIGFEVAKWMLKMGAKHILLAGRSPPKSSIQAIINQLNSAGANLIPVQLDVGNYDHCKTLIESINQKDGMNLPPLRGIMHAAGTISDGLIANQDWSKLSSTFNAKVAGTMNLHELSKNCLLEHFVMFSSAASLLGSPGQCNHTAANCFEDALVHYRHSVGLCATTINWGQWGEIGVAVEVDTPGMKAFSTLQGISALEYIMKTQRVQTAVINMESFVIFSKLFPQVVAYLDERIWKAAGSTTSITVKTDEFWQQYDSMQDHAEKLEIVKKLVKDILRKILKLELNYSIEDDSNFQEMGVDSLMFVEIKNSVQSVLGERVSISANVLRDCNNTEMLSQQLIKLIEGHDSIVEPEVPPKTEEVNELIREDCQLPEDVTAVGRSPKKISEVRRVLLTGVTGTLGPYILRELSQMSQIQEIYCLVRPSKSLSLQQRLEETLKSRDLFGSVTMEKVRYVAGNVSKKNLGMDDNNWEELSEIIEGIIHCAVKANHTQYYKKRELSSKVEDVRYVNVNGTKNIIEFACQGQVKHIFSASSLLSVATTDEDGTPSEDWPSLGDFDGVTKFAYPISKFVGDVLAKTAALHRNLPVKVFRFPMIAGDSKTGKFKIDANHPMLRYFFMLKSGIMPSLPLPMMLLPVDICASMSLKIFFKDAASGVYNITHPSPNLDQEFVHIAQELGYSINLVELDEFIASVLAEPDDSPFSLFKEVYMNKDEFMLMYTTSTMRKWLEGMENAWASKKISTMFPELYSGIEATMKYLQSNLEFAKNEGWLPKL